ncbi:MAG: DTW domain-containing protein [Deltaproteobacteria bacterium]|nr:DTW domain-containing protein [Deltaproteobacteria bacterium]
MAPRRHKNHPRCWGCRMHPEHCICALVPRLETSTRLALVAHRRELKKTTNSGLLAVRCLGERARVFQWGDEGTVIEPGELVPDGHQGVVLTPVRSQPLDAEALRRDGRPVVVVVPDGTWRQANKMTWRIPALAALPKVALPPGPPSRYRLREEPRDDGLATFEAIARIFGALEGPAVQAAMERVFDAMVTRTLATRGVFDHPPHGGHEEPSPPAEPGV